MMTLSANYEVQVLIVAVNHYKAAINSFCSQVEIKKIKELVDKYGLKEYCRAISRASAYHAKTIRYVAVILKNWALKTVAAQKAKVKQIAAVVKEQVTKAVSVVSAVASAVQKADAPATAAVAASEGKASASGTVATTKAQGLASDSPVAGKTKGRGGRSAATPLPAATISTAKALAPSSAAAVPTPGVDAPTVNLKAQATKQQSGSGWLLYHQSYSKNKNDAHAGLAQCHAILQGGFLDGIL